MIDYTKQTMQSESKSHRYFVYFKNSIDAIKTSKIKRYSVLMYGIIVFVTWVNRYECFASDNTSKLALLSLDIELLMAYVVAIIMLLALYGCACRDWIIRKKFFKIGFTNSIGDPPILMQYKKENGMLLIVFESCGITLSKWEDQQEALENALNISISSIKTGTKSDVIQIIGCKGKYDYTVPVNWKWEYQTTDDTINLGISMNHPVIVNLEEHAHFLIGGATGSGKTWLLKSLLMQCLNKEYKVYISDFKGGVDFPDVWQKKCMFSTCEDDTLNFLNKINAEIERRQSLLKEKGYRNIALYNLFAEERINRIVFACDELAELLNTKGLDKEAKERIKKIEAIIDKIARQGRAMGVHLLLATQRPDADVLSGQTKSNITYRICGRADEVLSKIVLDNTDARKRIPKDSRGVFLNHDGLIFKGYTFDEERDIIT